MLVTAAAFSKLQAAIAFVAITANSCPPPPSMTDSTILVETKKNIEEQQNKLGQYTIVSSYRETRNDVMSKIPNADSLIVDRAIAHIYCTLLLDDSSKSDEEKTDIYGRLLLEMHNNAN
ncbi:hypothetical protein [Azospirillum soli]|uniref:hypothetical protein n=1 Tax=Azospirillum soli TaxID=1304799 RepID=UPI001AE97AD7|nr:hypothetical protein [Azospirillum soli]MBP2311700.1 hypothetical protein [Azospirillum soli]